MEDSAIDAAAGTLWSAWQAGRHIDALEVQCRPRTRAEGYRVQSRIARLSGQKVFGWKIAATSKAGQEHIGVDGPLAGRLLEKRVFASGSSVPLSDNLMNVIEAEFAFRMERDLPPRHSAYAVAEVMAAVGSLHPAIEVPDSRYSDFVSVGAAQLIADNACANYFVLGPATAADWRTRDLSRHPATVHINGKIARQGCGDNVLGDPRLALAWIANELSLVGEGLGRGDTITTGTCIVPAPVAVGDHCVADFGEFGKVEASFVR